jgi:xylulokinase
MPHLLGIDLGTSSVKAVLVEAEDGRTVGQGSAEYPIHCSEAGFAEQDPVEWWRAAILAVRAALNSAERKLLPAAIGLSGQMHGTILLSAQDEPLSPAVIWPDLRSRDEVREITDRVGARRLIEITGSPLAPGFQAATLRWFQGERTEIWKRASKILLPKDYLRWRLTGEFASDPSDGSGTGMFDVQQRDWSVEILDSLQIEAGRLPSIQPSTNLAGELGPEVSNAFGLPPRLPVVIGAADTACRLLGVGAMQPGTLVVSISTGGQLIQAAGAPRIDRSGRTHTFCSALEPRETQAGWYRMGATLSAGQSLRWLKENVFALSDEGGYDQLTAMAEQVPVGSRGLIFLPYLAGERTPLMDPAARGLFLGLTLAHGRAEMVRAIMEGVTLSLYEAFRALVESIANPERILLAGGGARSRLWQQMVADVFGLPLRPLGGTEHSALGAAWLAGLGTGLISLDAMAPDASKYGPMIEPDLTRRETYQELLAIFRRAYRIHSEDFARLRDLR